MKTTISRITKTMCLITLLVILTLQDSYGIVIERKAGKTLTPVEMNIGDTLKFTLADGKVRTIVLKETDARPTFTTLEILTKYQTQGSTIYHITCELLIDGHPMNMIRYIGCQESFYEPYAINGMRIWFDGVAKIFDNKIVLENHGSCKPNKDARFVFTDMTGRICPETVFSFFDNKENFIDITNSYGGENCWMGPFYANAHGGLDVNLQKGTPSFTPFSLDNQFLFNNLNKGASGNRWRGVRTWANGDVWTVQQHHMFNLLVPENEPVKGGLHFSDAAGTKTGDHEHAHFNFQVKTKLDDAEILLDPWIIFWQAFEDNKKRNNEIKAVIHPFSPGKTSSPIQFSSKGSCPGINSQELIYYWTFGDGGFSTEANPVYTYAKPGIYPVTLTIDNGAHKNSFTQHITIDGKSSSKPALTISATDEPSFRIRPVQSMDVYNIPVRSIPHLLTFWSRPTRPVPESKILEIKNNGEGKLPVVTSLKINYFKGNNWLSVKSIGTDNNQKLITSADGSNLPSGRYTAEVALECKGALNSIQHFLVEMIIPAYPPSNASTYDVDLEIIDNEDINYNRFYCTPNFWVGSRVVRWKEKGYRGFYLTNGGRDVKGEYARFRPDLDAGKYEISFAKETPFDPQRRAMNGQTPLPVNRELNPGPTFAVRVHSKAGDEIVWIDPLKSITIGTFEFHEGMDGFVDILSEGSKGQVLVDAVVFRKIQSSCVTPPKTVIYSDFERGGIGQIKIINDTTLIGETVHWKMVDGHNYQSYWFYYRLENVKNKNISVTLNNLSGVYRGKELDIFTDNTFPVFSYNQKDWHRIENVSYDSLRKSFEFSQLFTEPVVWVAYAHPYTYSRALKMIDSLKSNQYVNIEVIGKSAEGRDINMLTITNNAIPAEQKRTVFIQSMLHSGEDAGAFFNEGVISSLLQNSTEAENYRNSFVFKIIPIVNVDGVVKGISRYNANLQDLNTIWLDSLIVEPEVLAIMNWYKKWKSEGGTLDVFIDVHNGSQLWLKNELVSQHPDLHQFHEVIKKYIKMGIWKGRFRGSSDQYFHEILQIPSATIELTQSHTGDKRYLTIDDYHEYGGFMVKALNEYYKSIK